MVFWETVNSEIKRQETTQEWLASKIGIKHSTLRSAISKNQAPRITRAYSIAKALGVSLDYLVTGSMPNEDYLSMQLHNNNDLKILTETAMRLPNNRINDLRHIAETWLPTSNGTKERLA